MAPMKYVEEKRGAVRGRTRSLAFVGLSIALMAVSAWISVPFGPVPFTLQTFVMVFAFLVLTPRECIAAIVGYLVLGAIGLPVFSSMRGGIGMLAGPTGGFLWGFLLGAVVALMFVYVVNSLGNAARGASKAKKTQQPFVVDGIAGLIFLTIMYVCGWTQLMLVAALSPAAAFATAVAPFVLIDTVKLVAAVFTARAVRKALR